jgi:hypothetical protein
MTDRHRCCSCGQLRDDCVCRVEHRLQSDDGQWICGACLEDAGQLCLELGSVSDA